jgi:CheY-like chemotaxis protein
VSNSSILLIEDDADVRESLVTILEALGKQVVVAANGQEGLAQLDSFAGEPSLILVDLLMPVLNGREFIQRLRADRPTLKTPVVLMSANHNALELVQELLGAGVSTRAS